VKSALGLALLAACSAAVAGPDDRPGKGSDHDLPAKRFERDMIVRFHMHENYGLLRAIERLLLRGKLEETRHLARAIAIAPDEPGASPWAAEALRVRERASALAQATTIDGACVAVARLAQECAACHAASGASPEFSAPPPLPPDRPSIDSRMVRHLWASQRLWEGMVGMADDAWLAGLDVLAASPLPASQFGAQRQPHARKLQQIADRARRAKLTPADRGAVYGELLATCAGCHAVGRP
jgi:cytochrome c553